MLFLLIFVGSAIFVSSAVLHIRKRAFEKKLEELAERKRRRLGIRTLTFSLSKRRASSLDPREAAIASGVVRGQAIRDPDSEVHYQPSFPAPVRMESADAEEKAQNGDVDNMDEQGTPEHITFGKDPHPLRPTESKIQEPQRRRSFLPDNSGVAAHGMRNHPRHAQPVSHEGVRDLRKEIKGRSGSLAGLSKYFDSFEGYIGRNSQFHHLTEKERRVLGGIEYDAICVLSWVVPLYFILFQLFGAIGIGAWLQINRPATALKNG
jgi:hypothetical protein